jgi:hypothetical protein
LRAATNSYWVGGYSFLSSTTLTAAQYYVRLDHMSRTRFGALYITPQGGHRDPSGRLLRRPAVRRDDPGRHRPQRDHRLPGIGRAHHRRGRDNAQGCWFFNNAVNPSSTGRNPVDKGQIMVRGTASEILIDGCNFGGFNAQTGYTPSTTPAVYASTGATSVKLANLMASNGGTKLAQHQSSGIITKYGMTTGLWRSPDAAARRRRPRHGRRPDRSRLDRANRRVSRAGDRHHVAAGHSGPAPTSRRPSPPPGNMQGYDADLLRPMRGDGGAS